MTKPTHLLDRCILSIVCSLALLFACSPFLFSENTSQPSKAVTLSAEDLIKKIEARRGIWTQLSAEIQMSFLNSRGQEASCEGRLLYQRLEERLLIQCFKKSKRRVFTFRTHDRDFELYLPAHHTLYKGNIFQLEDSPAIESHLKALDLYRALKPAVVARDAGMKISKGKTPGLEIFRLSPEGQEMTLRSLEINSQGDVTKENYYGQDGNLAAVIRRSDFEAVSSEAHKIAAGAFPKRIEITARKENTDGVRESQTVLSFKTLDFQTLLDDTAFKFKLPESTRRLTLEDPLN